MTKTCSRCNNEFGRLEAVIADSYAGVLSATRFAGGDVPGSRHGGKVRIRNLPDGSFVLVVDGRHSDPALPHIFRGGTFSLTADEPDDDRLRIALLKNAYLAACLVLGTIPDSDDAAALRSELLAAINASTPAAGRFAASLVKLRLYDEPPHPLYRARVHRDDTVTYGFGLGKFGFVSWPIPDLLEAARPFYSCNPQLGQP